MSDKRAMSAGDCPSPDAIERVVSDRAAEDEVAVVRDHLSRCPSCRRRFDEALGINGEMDQMRAAAPGSGEHFAKTIKLADARQEQTPIRDGDHVVLHNGLRLDPPRDTRYVGRLGVYDVVSVVGVGAMGVVLRAYDQKLKRHVALKLVSPKLANDQNARQRFLREARSAARLNHPGIVTVYAVDDTWDPPFIAMEYVRGASLSSVVTEEAPLEAVRAARIARQILHALEHAHGQGIIHRDIKPSNVLLTRKEGAAKLVDFGLARGVADVVRYTEEGMVTGTPWYMSPEQASGARELDPRSDLFSVGIMLFEMLAGALPFPGPDPHFVMKRIREELVPDLAVVNPSVPRDLVSIVHRAVERDVSKRYQTASAFLQDLDRFLSSRGLASQEKRAAEREQAKTATGQTFARCSACSQVIVSKLGVAGSCEICGASICHACWKARGVRQCARHTGARASSDSGDTDASPVESPETTKTELPPSEGAKQRTRVEKGILEARAKGVPAVSAPEARLAEETFLRLVENAISSLTRVVDPISGASAKLKAWSKLARRTDRKDVLGDALGPAGAGEEAMRGYPLCAGLVLDLSKRGRRAFNVRVVIEARFLAHLEELAEQGRDARSVSRLEVESLLNETSRRAAEEEAYHLIMLGSATGWGAAARDLAAGERSRRFRDRRVSLVLFDQESGGFLYDETDEKLSPYREMLSTDMDAEILEDARKFIGTHLRTNESISLETFIDTSRTGHKAAVQVFEVLGATDEYVLDVLDGVGMVLYRAS